MGEDRFKVVALASRPVDSKTRAYVRLAKLDFYDYYLSVLIVWTLLPTGERFAGRALLTLASFLASEVCLIVATVAFDDLTGYRDGSDAVNYGPDAPARRLARKPLLTGALTPNEARRFGLLTVTSAALLLAVSLAVAPHRPMWVIVSSVSFLVLSVQYSWGIKISYRGGQESLIAGIGVALVILPYALLTGTAPGFVVAQAMLLGLGQLLIGVYSNINDIGGDAGVGRPTLAVVLSPRSNAVFVGGVSVAETVIIAGAGLTGVAPWWFPLAMLPSIAFRAAQFVTGIRRGKILEARRLGIWTFRTAMVLLLLINLVHPSAGGHVR